MAARLLRLATRIPSLQAAPGLAVVQQSSRVGGLYAFRAIHSTRSHLAGGGDHHHLPEGVHLGPETDSAPPSWRPSKSEGKEEKKAVSDDSFMSLTFQDLKVPLSIFGAFSVLTHFRYYIPDEETPHQVALVWFFWAGTKAFGQPLKEYLTEQRDSMIKEYHTLCDKRVVDINTTINQIKGELEITNRVSQFYDTFRPSEEDFVRAQNKLKSDSKRAFESMLERTLSAQTRYLEETKEQLGSTFERSLVSTIQAAQLVSSANPAALGATPAPSADTQPAKKK
eukprot:TRINITY_DN435_c0_g1::TRINITY_DN435_c0_g1_i1::g.2556::m.2556 TRINITY_DN435_c0_g1::TRINITY_DN435_c0_g1_i1::g.2556  ORF type:complete len:294 (-),score=90.98,Mt_ATP-synt_B/PF05405.9/1.4e-05 TRINITY_DN435_c0_g1_i1:27-872(-)